MIEPFFLGGEGPELFVTYHPPSGGFAKEITVVCAPFFGEFIRSQLSLRELAISLSAAGQNVFRFDYRGSGDSFGEAESLQAWASDLLRVVVEAKDLSGCDRVNLVAVRGATLLLPPALEKLQGVGRVVLWDPIWRGEPYLSAFMRLRDSANYRNRWMTGAMRRDIVDELFGFPLPTRLADDIRAADAHAYFAGHPVGTVTAVVTDTTEDPPTGVTTRRIRYDCNWLQRSDDILLPQPVLEEIRECLLDS